MLTSANDPVPRAHVYRAQYSCESSGPCTFKKGAQPRVHSPNVPRRAVPAMGSAAGRPSGAESASRARA
eukprot:1180388-Prorocentrum_minimum.AAC.1